MKLLIAAFALLLGTQAAAAEDVSILIKNFDFGPMNVTVAPGTTVVWKNLDGEPHTVASADGLFRSQALDQNDSYRFTFDKAGTFRYICSIHPNMKATITVK
ncbi:MAG TPA: cupredoxin family copper-binding protein [Rhizomicrobium sp.]